MKNVKKCKNCGKPIERHRGASDFCAPCIWKARDLEKLKKREAAEREFLKLTEDMKGG